MAKKVANPEKLKVEMQLQQSKMQSLIILDRELDEKVKRLTLQHQAIREKINRLDHAYKLNAERLKSLNGN